jgi:hypothetical protein
MPCRTATDAVSDVAAPETVAARRVSGTAGVGAAGGSVTGSAVGAVGSARGGRVVSGCGAVGRPDGVGLIRGLPGVTRAGAERGVQGIGSGWGRTCNRPVLDRIDCAIARHGRARAGRGRDGGTGAGTRSVSGGGG